ncbi:FkbM family methyltransferase, partial [Citricoccus sp. NPDC079358]|uniref:FkbM family methyltransferase n=1 Tax=Citricoccus sp. NPDC079358 TaxID=3154653 RepID=UPI00344BE721
RLTRRITPVAASTSETTLPTTCALHHSMGHYSGQTGISFLITYQYQACSSVDQGLVLPVRFGIPIRGHAHIGRDRGNGHSRIVGSRQRMTSVHTVDSWCHLHGVEEVSFIKADVEGFEPEVLEGAAATIDRSRPSMLLEVEDRHIGRYGRDANQFVTDVRRRWPDYAMYTWCDDSWKLTDRVDVDKRNYLFATDAAFNRI